MTKKKNSISTCTHTWLLLLATICLAATSLPGMAQAAEESYAVLDTLSGTLTFRHDAQRPATDYAFELSTGYTPAWEGQKGRIREVVFDCSFVQARPTTCSNWFKDCETLRHVKGMQNLNTESVTSMRGMFYNCYELEGLDVSTLETRKVENMSHMFFDCHSLTSLDVSGFDTRGVTDMSCMFTNCPLLTTLDVSGFDTRGVTDMNYMFANCRSLAALNLANFDTRGVTDMSRMFSGCSSLTTIYASSKFVTSAVEDGKDNMFPGCTHLQGAVGYDEDNTGKDHANYTTGYLTHLAGMLGQEKIILTPDSPVAGSLHFADSLRFAAYDPFPAAGATYRRTGISGQWASLCLPFEVRVDSTRFRAFTLLAATSDAIELQEMQAAIPAGRPAIIKVATGVTTLALTNDAPIISPLDGDSSSTGDGRYRLVGLYRMKVFDQDADTCCLVLKGDMLLSPARVLQDTHTRRVASRPYRAYVQGNGQESTHAAQAMAIIAGDGATPIRQLEGTGDGPAEYYDLQGHRLEEPLKGTNIMKRGNKVMKVIIR